MVPPEMVSRFSVVVRLQLNLVWGLKLTQLMTIACLPKGVRGEEDNKLLS